LPHYTASLIIRILVQFCMESRDRDHCKSEAGCQFRFRKVEKKRPRYRCVPITARRRMDSISRDASRDFQPPAVTSRVVRESEVRTQTYTGWRGVPVSVVT